MANAMDEYDIRRAFDVLDPCQDGVVTLNDLQTLYLGLGYVPPKTVPELRSLVRQHQQADDDDDNDDENRVTLETTLKLLSKTSRKNRSELLRHGFQLLDRGNKGYLDVNDVQQWASVEATNKPNGTSTTPLLSTLRASKMLNYFAAATPKGKGDDNDRPSSSTLGPEEFLNIYSPQDP